MSSAKQKIHDRRDYRRLLILVAKERPCADCGDTFHPCVMDFDHVRGEKRFEIGKNGDDRKVSTLFEEIKKCDLVCANCHRIRTYKKRKQPRVLSFTLEDIDPPAVENLESRV